MGSSWSFFGVKKEAVRSTRAGSRFFHLTENNKIKTTYVERIPNQILVSRAHIEPAPYSLYVNNSMSHYIHTFLQIKFKKV